MKTETTTMNDFTIEYILRYQNTEKWEINGIGQFLLGLQDTNVIYHVNGVLTLDKSVMRQEFEKYLNASNNVTLKAQFRGSCIDIGLLLQKMNFLLKTPRRSNVFRINDIALDRFRHEKFHEFDELQRNGGRIPNNNSDNNNTGNVDIDLEKRIKVHTIDTSKIYDIQYRGSQTMCGEADFELSSCGCLICQRNFQKIEEFEEHVEYHNDESDFKPLKSMEKLSSPMLKVSYQLCVKSHFFAFTLESATLDDLIIDGIIIVKSRTFHYANQKQMPQIIPSKGQYIFFLDSQLFKISEEQPIAIVLRKQDKSDRAAAIRKYYVEQHNFMRTEPFPIVHFGVNPKRLSNAMLLAEKIKLKTYFPSYKFVKALNSNYDNNNLLFEESESFRKYFQQQKCLTLQNMAGAMVTMLQVEDVERLNIYRKMTQTNVHLRPFGKEISLQLNSTNIAFNENIPSPGDNVIMIVEKDNNQMPLANENDFIDLILKSNKEILRKFKGNNQEVFIGNIEMVMNHRAIVKCHMILPQNRTYTIVIRPGRFTFRQQYHALAQLKMFDQNVLKRLLFPEMDRTMDPLADIYNLELNNRTIYGNPEQLKAVKQIAKSNSLQTPFILFGPPGTGKTATIVESIMQLLIQRSDTRILVMAGSNGACDEISMRLLRLLKKTPLDNKKTLARIFARSSDKRIDNIDESLLAYSNMYSVHFYPHLSILHDYPIVVCTLSVAGKMSLNGFGKNCEDYKPVITHIFVDEAAAVTETETLMGITCAISPSATLILSGDPKQLGAVLQSKRAESLGLGVSLMERLLKRECYQVDEDGEYNCKIQSRLRRNYRSHPEIVKLYSDLYYDGQLIALASKDEVNLSEKWYKTPNTKFPIIFHAEFGTAYKSLNSVSLCNHREINAVMSYVRDFMYFGINGKRLKQSDIGIISPYKNQCRMIQEQLNVRKWHQIECGSVETFQGKEKQIIIVSFVRSFSETLGFLDNPRRLNVTLSRPKSLLILIGNPKTLSLNNDFKHIIDMCKREGSFVGAPLYEDVDKIGLITAFNRMVICKKSNRKNKKRASKSVTSKAKTTDKKTTVVTTNNKSFNEKTASAPLEQSTKICTFPDQPSNKIIDKDDKDRFFESLPRVPETLCCNNGAINATSDVLPEKDTSKTMLNKTEVTSADVVPTITDGPSTETNKHTGNIGNNIGKNETVMNNGVVVPFKREPSSFRIRLTPDKFVPEFSKFKEVMSYTIIRLFCVSVVCIVNVFD